MSEKYKTLKDLKVALDSGELKLKAPRDRLVIDNDVCFLYLHSEEDEDDATCVFRLHPADLLEQALELMGIPWDNA